jgi:hypothetical protein
VRSAKLKLAYVAIGLLVVLQLFGSNFGFNLGDAWLSAFNLPFYVYDHLWKTPEDREQERQQEFLAQQEEFKARDDAEQKCREELAMDMDDCIGYRMREYHRGKKLYERWKAESKKYKENK